jgi:hypothetical protein
VNSIPLTVTALVISTGIAMTIGTVSTFAGQSQAHASVVKIALQEPSLEKFVLDGMEEGGKGSKPSGVCNIAPSPRGGVFLTDRPTFIWQGTVKRVEVRTVVDRTLLWGKDISSREQMATFPNNLPPLLPGTQYLLVFDGDYNSASPFQLVKSGLREQLLVGMSNQGKTLPKQRLSKSAIALQKATYLGEQKLWLDAFGLLFTVPLADVPLAERADWNANLTKLKQGLCNPGKS